MILCRLFGHHPIVVARRGHGELSDRFGLTVECRRCCRDLRLLAFGSGLPVLIDAFEADVGVFGKRTIYDGKGGFVEMAIEQRRDPDAFARRFT